MHRTLAWMPALLTLLGITIVNFVFAQGGEPSLIKVLDGVTGNFKKDSLVTVEDAKWWNPTEQAKIDLTLPYSVRNIITFKLNEESTKRIDTNFTTTIKVKIIYTKKDASVDSIDHWFTINYNDTSGLTYNSQRILSFNDGYRVTTRIDSILTTFPAGATPWDVTPHLRLENEMQISRFYNFSCTAVPTSLTYTTNTIATTGDLRYIWPDVAGATEYDVEWTFIDSTIMAEGLLYGTIASPDRAKIFEAGSSRMTVYTSPIYLPLVYDNSSYLFVRIRAVQVRPSPSGGDGGGRIEGTWYPSTGVGYYFTGHETGLNWQSTTTFAEEAKRKTVISYADGSLKQRQTVTKDNNAAKIIASETLYDYQGRPAIQVLPAPNLGGVIKYVHDLNKSLAGGEYEKSLYDSLVNPADYCSTPSPAMNTSSGANNYYSTSNPSKAINNPHKALPEAYGYAFAETRYAQDNTGRVMAQGGVGQQYQPGSKHETKYYYGKPDHQELAALFGTEAGDATHYQKNMVRDANGQYSVSYVDMKGRTIATALAGVPDTALVKLDTLDSWNTRTITRRLLDSAITVIDGHSMQSTMGLVVTEKGNHVFRYTLAPDSIRLMSCDSSDICYDCLYNLEISISDECANQNLPGGQRFVLLDTNFTMGSIDTTCNAIGFDTTFTLVNLPEGSYTISKKLTVSRPGYEYYRDSVFMIKNFCKSFEEFYAEELAILQQDCAAQTCEGCNAALGTLEEFGESYAESNGIPTDQLSQYEAQIEKAYLVAKSNCDQLCDSLNENDVIREIMLADMMPDGGQYANPADSGHTNNIFHKPGSVYNFKDVSPEYYTDENGKRDSIFNSQGQLVPPTDPSITAAEFAAQFKPSWAEALLPLHPEYDKYSHYETLRASNTWDAKFAATGTYAEAMSMGYLNPIAQTGINFIPADSSKMDPLFGLNGTLYTSLRNKVLSFQSINSINRSMWGVATATSHCNDGDDACFTTFLQNANAFDSISLCRGELDMAWRTFQQFYQTEKRKIISTWLETNWPASITTPYLERFPDLTVLPGLAGGPAPGSGAATILSVAADSLNSMYQSNCEAYAETWWRQLASCNFDTLDKAIIMPRLVQVCINGSDANHPLGSSSISPTSVYAYHSFDDVIKNYLDSTGGTYNAACNGYLITAPAPYEQPSTYANQPLWTRPDSCQCEKITSMHQQFLAAPFSDSNFSGYLKRKINVDMTEGELQDLLNMCSATVTCKFLEQPIMLPPQLQCGIKSTCVGCDSISAWHNRFTDSLGVNPAYDDNDSLQSLHNRLYENYMNYHSGLNKSYTAYLLFMDSCDAITANSQCDTLKQVLADFRQSFYHEPSFDLAYNADGCDTITWRFAGSQAVDTGWVKFRDMFHNGVVRTPDSVYSHLTSHLWSDSSKVKVFNLTYPRIICNVNNDFSWDVGVKHKLFDGSPGADGVLLNMKLYDEDGNITVIYVRLFQFQAGAITVDTIVHPSGNLQVDLTNWRNIKVKIINNFLKVYVDGVFRFEVDLGFEVVNAGHFTVIANRVDMSVDYLRIFDGSGGVILSEDFTNACESFAVQNPIYDCDKGYCATAFTDFYNDARGTSLTETQVQALYVTHCGKAAQPCLQEDDGIKLCSEGALFPQMKMPDQGPCSDSSQLAFALATERYNTYRDSLLAAFDSLYLGKCMKAYEHEDFTVTAPQSEFHYTLYYYDQAGNLVRTVPPAGVDTSKFSHLASWADSVKTAKANGQLLTPHHGLPTDYRYNTLNQVKAQKSPDGGRSQFWYDRLGRLVLSQNAKQLPGDWYSYTVYDSIGRITEVGELSHVNGPSVINDSITRDQSALNDLITLNTRRQITNTYYDVEYAGWSGYTEPIVAKNLRSRVSYTTYTEDSNPACYDQATFFSYDIHGNVDTLVHDYRTGAMSPTALGQRFKKIVYQYDLISGKVNHVAYQPNKKDQFYHRYAYDAENRITQAQTSADSIVWEREALYSYYLHGPLSRVQLGQYKVQGQDYAYTLQGWLKAINGMPNRGNELGNDGGVTFANQYTGIDAYSIQLHYNTNDYTAILSNCNCVANTLTLPATHNLRNLYNGNIAGMSVSIPTLNNYPLTSPTTHFGSMYYNYKYDQLNRLKQMDTYTRMLVSSSSIIYSTALSDYKERIKYDANGNILKYLRHGMNNSSVTGLATGPLAMDSLVYKYYAGTNQLRQVKDTVNGTNYTEDIDNQSDTSNYVYDAIGNLIKDTHEKIGLDSIRWNVYGKITSILKRDSTNIFYGYDAGGNRISKMVVLHAGSASPDTTTTWYARDATGNVMSVYRIRKDTVYQDELHLYGSSRIGILKPERNLNLDSQYGDTSVSVSILGTAKGNVFRRGQKFFELANHLGNVLVTISDKKNGHDAAGDGNVDYYKPVVMSANDYYPGGMLMPGRKINASNLVNGFNRKRYDNEVYGEGNFQDYGFRMYDPRRVQFISVDPLAKEYPELTPYQFASNTPIQAIDLDGLESQRAIDGSTVHGPLYMPKVNEDILKQRTANQQNSALLKDATITTGGATGARAAQAGFVRLNYAFKNYSLKPVFENGSFAEKVEASKTRNRNVLEARKLTPEPYLSFAKDLKSGDNLKVNPEGKFYKTNPKVNITMGIIGTAGTAVMVYGVYNSYQNIKNSNDKTTTVIQEGASWGGALYGGSVGAGWGAAGGPWGVAAGTFVGSLVGGIGGREAIEALKNSLNNEANPTGPWMFNGRAAPDNTVVKPPLARPND